MRSGVPWVLGVVVVAVLLLLQFGVKERMLAVQTFGVAPAVRVVQLRGGQEVCEVPVGLARGIDAVEFHPASTAASPPAIRVSVRSVPDNRVLAEGQVASGYDAARPQTATLDRSPPQGLAAVCFRNEGPARVGLFGDRVAGSPVCTRTGHGAASRGVCTPGGLRPILATAIASVDAGRALEGDLAVTLKSAEPRSYLSLAPAMVERASLFRPGFVRPALWWILLAAWLVALPFGMAYAVRAARAPGRPEERP